MSMCLFCVCVWLYHVSPQVYAMCTHSVLQDNTSSTCLLSWLASIARNIMFGTPEEEIFSLVIYTDNTNTVKPLYIEPLYNNNYSTKMVF